ncbi:Myzus persicae-induced lipase 1 [Prunus dulcis]|uniref:Myzus persicae-induced lipase 1 n=1 Tax=Prunus dulcis TaxID=3755 RepID=A0A4Y1R7F7_PRUDU|nr:Myzus persicae-induced lipase 1 [Prunus dulcis]
MVVAATRTKLQSINNLDVVGICKSMVETQGYTCQEHQVTTADGYILGLQRIPKGRSGNEIADRQPVLLQHGLLMDASAWLLNPPDQSLAFILADNGFDVWLANSRGTNSSRGHPSLSPDDDLAYWDWSWDELASHDLPAFFQYVNNQTGQKLHYVGHSLGTLTALAAFSQEKLLNLLRSAALLSPVAYLGQMSSLFVRILMDVFLAEKLKLLGLQEFPNGRGMIKMYDYDLEDTNMEHYKQPTPPAYNMTNIPKNVPLFLSYGLRDKLSDANDVGLLLDNLKDHDKDKLVVQCREEYAHMDFIIKTTKLKMSNPSTTLLLLALLCVSAVAATRTKLNSINNLDDGICKSMVETQGYTCQEHELTTADGYILGLQRIPNGRSCNETAEKLPVLLQHGVFLDASSWLLNPPDQALPFILADNGFDVWLVNSRGTSPSRGHTSLSPKDPAYWDWSWDELVAYDLPASFQYVNNQTGHKLHYVGHSLGTLTALAAFSEEKLLNLLRSAALLSPVAYLGHISSLILRPAVDIFAAEADPTTCGVYLHNTGIDCSNLLAAIGGPNCCLNSSSIDALVVNDPQPTATKNLIHLSQIVRKGTVEMYDYGLEDTNIKHYKKPTPPVYNMANIPKDVPLFFSYGGRDSIAGVNDVGILLDKLRDHDREKLVVEYREEYAHVDFIMSVNANQVVYGPLLAFFRLH